MTAATLQHHNPYSPCRAVQVVQQLTSDQRARESHPEQHDEHDSQLRARLICFLLRFRNLNGTKFNSAAQSRLQNHDKLV
jgi:hypothetical protein